VYCSASLRESANMIGTLLEKPASSATRPAQATRVLSLTRRHRYDVKSFLRS
jgi:hypothetical protein